MLTLVLWLSAAACAAQRADFPQAFAGNARAQLAREPFYASTLIASVEGHLKNVSGMGAPGARAYLEGAAGVADAAGVKKGLEAGTLDNGRAGALLVANALVRPDQFRETLDSLETLKPGLGAKLSEVFSKADGEGDRGLIAALRAAGKRSPQGAMGVYDASGRWKSFFDGAGEARAYDDGGVVAAPARTYAPPRSSSLKPRIPARVSISGDKFVLRSPEESDVPAFAELLDDARVVEYLPFLQRPGMIGWTYGMVQARMERKEKAQKEQMLVNFAIVDKSGGKTIGDSALDSIDLERGTASYGLIVSPEAWGTGAAAEAHRLGLGYAFETLGLKRVEMFTMAGNARMRGFYAKHGVRLDGPKKWSPSEDGPPGDWVAYSVSAEDWPRLRASLGGARRASASAPAALPPALPR